MKKLILILMLLMPIASYAQSQYYDTAIGVYCKGELIRIFVVDRYTNRTIKEWGKRVPTNEEFSTWVKEYYNIEDGNDVTLNVRGIRVTDCSVS